jgi:hypothetical protein
MLKRPPNPPDLYNMYPPCPNDLCKDDPCVYCDRGMSDDSEVGEEEGEDVVDGDKTNVPEGSEEYAEEDHDETLRGIPDEDGVHKGYF